MMTMQIIVSGKVQGVFFRSNVKRKALELGLVGFAKNLENDDVEVVAQGTAEKLAELQAFMRSNPGAALVKGIKDKDIDLGKLSGFLIL